MEVIYLRKKFRRRRSCKQTCIKAFIKTIFAVKSCFPPAETERNFMTFFMLHLKLNVRVLKFAGLRIKYLFRIKRNETLIYLYCRFVHFILVVSKCESWVPFRDSGVSNRSCTAVDTNRHDDDSAGILFHYLCKWDLLSESPFYDIFNR